MSHIALFTSAHNKFEMENYWKTEMGARGGGGGGGRGEGGDRTKWKINIFPSKFC